LQPFIYAPAAPGNFLLLIWLIAPTREQCPVGLFFAAGNLRDNEQKVNEEISLSF
jgi:hypothetical protein